MVNSNSNDEKDSPFPTLSYKQAVKEPAEFIVNLRSALLTSGFFYLSDIDQILPTFELDKAKLFEDTASFFDLSEEEKSQIGMINSRHFRGWNTLGNELTQGKRDLREQIDFGPDTEALLPYPPIPSNPIELYLYGPNQFPLQIATFKESLQTYRNDCSKIALQLASLIAESLTTEPTYITDLFQPPTTSTTSLSKEELASTPAYSRMKIVRYPPVSRELAANNLGVGPHKDGGSLTLLAQDDVGGLEVQDWSGNWKGVKPKEGTLVINVGQVIERISHGLYPATTHRVLSTVSSKPRYSIPFFFSPHLLRQVHPLPLSTLQPFMLKLLSSDDELKIRESRKTEVKKNDLHAAQFGESAWRGITRSHKEVWEKWYGRDLDTVGGPDEGAEGKVDLL